MTKAEKRTLRRLLIYLFEYFERNNTLIFKEIIEKNICPTDEVVDKWFEENNIDENAYCTVVDNKRVQKKCLKDSTNPLFVYMKN